MNGTNPPKRLYKSRTERMIDGVCGGVAEYFNLDPTLVRIAWVLLTLFGGSGILLYIIAMIVIPSNPVLAPPVAPPDQDQRSKSSHKFWGILLVLVGVLWLFGNLGFPFWHHWWGLSWGFGLPLVLILAGVAFLFGGRNYISGTTPAGEASPAAGTVPPAAGGPQPVQKLYRSRLERKIFGVCGGLGTHLNVDPTIIRILFIAGVFASFGLAVLLYIIMAFVIPEEPLVIHA
jgi:phage shock protein PspC (stress-responsive transcriptional regulator)